VFGLPGTMLSIVECYPAGRSVSAVAVIVADDHLDQKQLTYPADPVTSHVGCRQQSARLTPRVTWLSQSSDFTYDRLTDSEVAGRSW